MHTSSGQVAQVAPGLQNQPGGRVDWGAGAAAATPMKTATAAKTVANFMIVSVVVESVGLD
jgi:hypothetical protein